MNANGSAVVQALEKASHEAWKRWRKHVEDRTAETPEGIEAHEEAKLAGSVWLDEMFDRAARSRAA